MPIISGRLLASDEAKPAAKPFELRDDRLPGFILRVQPSGVRTFYAQVARGRRMLIGRVGEMTADEARTRCTKLLGNIANGRAALDGIQGRADVTFGSFLDGVYEPWVKAHRPRTAYKTLHTLKLHFAHWRSLGLSEITAEKIEAWKTKRLEGGAKPASVLRNVDSLAGVFAHAVRLEKLESSPTRGVVRPKVDRTPKVRYLSEPEESRLREALAARDAQMIKVMETWKTGRPSVMHFGDHLTAAVLISMNTGMRRGELLALTWDDVDLVTNLITIGGATTKNMQTRYVPLNSEAALVLARYREQVGCNDRLFPFSSGFKTAWSELLKQARIRNFRWHDLRHHFASRLVQRGAALNTVRELLGHGDIRMVLRYAHLSPKETRAAVDLLNK